MSRHSGKSISEENPKGVRRTSVYGELLAPHSLRHKYSLFIDCPVEKLKKIGLNDE